MSSTQYDAQAATRREGAGRRNAAERLLRTASFASPLVALLLIALKAWGWWQTGSVALLSSLADSLLDLAASLITFFAIRVSLTPPDDEHRFGHGKSEAVAGIVQAALIALSAMFVVLEAVRRLSAPTLVHAPAAGVSIIAVSLVATALLVVFQRWVVRRTGSFALTADEAHYRTDLLSGLAVGAAILAGARAGWWWVDPLVGLAVAAWLVHTASGIARLALRDLLDAELPRAERARVRRLILGHDHVRGVHDLRTRSAGQRRFIQVHVELDPALTLEQAHQISDEIERELLAALDDAEILIHLDPAGVEPAHGYERDGPPPPAG